MGNVAGEQGLEMNSRQATFLFRYIFNMIFNATSKYSDKLPVYPVKKSGEFL